MEREPGGGRKLLEKKPFTVLISENKDLSEVREEYARRSPTDRRKAADFQYHSEIAGDLFDNALAAQGLDRFTNAFWPPGVLPLAIDPFYPPALLTVGALEYDLDRTEEAMKLFFTLLTFPPDEEDLHTIVDKAGDFLIERDDFENALKLYSAAEKAYPDQAVYLIGSGYCLEKMGRFDEAIEKDRQAVKLEPDNYLHLNDLGYALFEAGKLAEAEEVLEKAVSLSPEDYELSRNNLQYVREQKED